MWRGGGAGLGREGAPSAGHPGNNTRRDKRNVGTSSVLQLSSEVHQVQLDEDKINEKTEFSSIGLNIHHKDTSKYKQQ